MDKLIVIIHAEKNLNMVRDVIIGRIASVAVDLFDETIWPLMNSPQGRECLSGMTGWRVRTTTCDIRNLLMVKGILNLVKRMEEKCGIPVREGIELLHMTDKQLAEYKATRFGPGE
jgi:hypothetical protein